MKKLYRSQDNKVWEGILGGFGEYYDIDPTILRVFFLIFVICTGIFPGVLAYILAIFIIPRTPSTSK